MGGLSVPIGSVVVLLTHFFGMRTGTIHSTTPEPGCYATAINHAGKVLGNCPSPVRG
jgi:hypothetical protein